MKATSLKIFSRVTKVDAPVQGMLTIVIIQSGLALMTISPSLNSQFNVLVNPAVVKYHSVYSVNGGISHYSEGR